MKFMLMMHTPRGTGDYEIFHWPAGRLDAHVAFMKALNRDLEAAGEIVSVAGLAPPEQARIVRATPGSDEPEVTDGPFAESKEFLAGFWIVDVENAARAYAIARRASTAPGPDGKPMSIKIEVRPVMGAPSSEP